MGNETFSPAKPTLTDLFQDFARSLRDLWNTLSNDDRVSALGQLAELVAGLVHEDKASEGPVLDHLAEFLAQRLRVDFDVARAAAATLCESHAESSHSKESSASSRAKHSAAEEELLRRARELLLMVRVHYEVKKPLQSYERRVEIFFEPEGSERQEDDRPRILAYRESVDWVDLPANARAAMISGNDRPVAYDIYSQSEARS